MDIGQGSDRCMVVSVKERLKVDGSRHGNHSTRQGGRVTKGRLREASVSLCRNKVMLFHVPLKTLCQWAEAERDHQPSREIVRLPGSEERLFPGKGVDPNDIQIPTTAF